MAFPVGWARKCAIVIDHTKVGSGGASNFTVCLTRANLPNELCSPTDANRAQANGGDVRFSSDSAGATQLACQIDTFGLDTSDGAGDGVVRLHVIVPSLSSATDTTIYVWYHTASGTETQPASTDTYGSKAAWDTYHCHRWSLDEAVGGSAPQFADSVGDRHLTVAGSGSTSVTGHDGNAFDGNASGYAVGAFSGFVTPNNNAAVPLTNTGCCYIPEDDRIAIANFNDGKIHEINKTTGAEITSFELSDGPAAGEVQGIAWNPVAARWACVGYTSATIKLYQRDGTYDTAMSTSAAGAICYDFTANCYWIIPSAGTLRSINTSTGATIASVSLASPLNTAAIDGITHCVTNDTIYVTTDNPDDMVYEVNKSTGAIIRSFRGPSDIEHPAYDHTDDILWVNGDARYHHGADLGENVLYKLQPDGQPWAWRSPTTEMSVEWWWNPDTVETTGSILDNWGSTVTGAFFLETQVRSSGIVRTYKQDASYLNTASSAVATGSFHHWRITHDASASTLKVYKDNAEVASASSVPAFSGSAEGRFSVGGRPTGTTLHNGKIDEVRYHRSRRDAAWWATRFENANAPTTFSAAGTPEAGSTTVTLAGAAASTAWTVAAGVLATLLSLSAAAPAAAWTVPTGALTTHVTVAGTAALSTWAVAGGALDIAGVVTLVGDSAAASWAVPTVSLSTQVVLSGVSASATWTVADGTITVLQAQVTVVGAAAVATWVIPSSVLRVPEIDAMIRAMVSDAPATIGVGTVGRVTFSAMTGSSVTLATSTED